MEERRQALQSYLQALLDDKLLRNCVALKQFLEVPLPRTHRPIREFYDLVRDIRNDLQLARRHLQSHTSESYVQVKATLHNVEKTFAELNAIEAKVSDAEKRRRKDVCDELHREMLALITLSQNYRHSAPVPSPFAAKRQLGRPKETDATLSQTNEELLHSQTQMMTQQDDLLVSLLPVIQRQKELGHLIGQEVDEHTLMLNDVADRTDKINGNLNKGETKIKKLK